MAKAENRRSRPLNGAPGPNPTTPGQPAPAGTVSGVDIGEWTLVSYVLTIPAMAIGQPPRQEAGSALVEGWITHPGTIDQLARNILGQAQERFIAAFPNATIEATNIARGMSCAITGWQSPDPRQITLMASRAMAKRQGTARPANPRRPSGPAPDPTAEHDGTDQPEGGPH